MAKLDKLYLEAQAAIKACSDFIRTKRVDKNQCIALGALDSARVYLAQAIQTRVKSKK